MNNKIRCEKCFRNGDDRVICEILNGGTIAIERYRKKFGNSESTRISGTDFVVTCGYCLTPVYIQRKEVHENSHIGTIRFFRISIGQGTYSQTTYDLPYNPRPVIQSLGSAQVLST